MWGDSTDRGIELSVRRESTVRTSAESMLAMKTAKDELEALYRAKRRSIYNFFIAKGFSPEESRELVQDTFCEAYRSIDRFAGTAQLGTWLVAVAKNLWRGRVRDDLRQKRTGHEIAIDDLEARRDDSVARQWREKTTGRSGLEQILDNEKYAVVRAEIDNLPVRMRQCLQLRVDHGLQYKEIAEALSISVGTAKSNVSDAKARLRERCAEHFRA